MEERPLNEVFSLLGGPLHRLGCRMGLVRRGSNTVALGLALGALLWTVGVALALVEGSAPRLFSLSFVCAHVRLLVVIPLMFVCESSLEPQVLAFLGMVVRSGIVPDHVLPALGSAAARTARWRDSWLAEAICLLAAVSLPLIAPRFHLSGTTAVYDPTSALGEIPMAGFWYSFVCLTVFRFLMLRWTWCLGRYTYFLWRLARLELRLVPTHPDGVAGLGYLEVVHTRFAPLVAAISSLHAAALAEELSAGKMALEATYPTLAAVAVFEAVLVLGPLFLFTPQLWACREKGLSDYMEFAMHYVSDFHRRWLRTDAPPEQSLLGTSVMMSLADLSKTISIIRGMRTVPLSMHLLTCLATPALLPVLPLLLFKYPIGELTVGLFTKLFGL